MTIPYYSTRKFTLNGLRCFDESFYINTWELNIGFCATYIHEDSAIQAQARLAAYTHWVEAYLNDFIVVSATDPYSEYVLDNTNNLVIVIPEDVSDENFAKYLCLKTQAMLGENIILMEFDLKNIKSNSSIKIVDMSAVRNYISPQNEEKKKFHDKNWWDRFDAYTIDFEIEDVDEEAIQALELILKDDSVLQIYNEVLSPANEEETDDEDNDDTTVVNLPIRKRKWKPKLVD